MNYLLVAYAKLEQDISLLLCHANHRKQDLTHTQRKCPGADRMKMSTSAAGSLLIVMLLRTAHYNLSKLKDVYLHTNTLAALANLAPNISNLSSHAAQRIISLLEMLCRRWGASKLSNGPFHGTSRWRWLYDAVMVIISRMGFGTAKRAPSGQCCWNSLVPFEPTMLVSKGWQPDAGTWGWAKNRGTGKLAIRCTRSCRFTAISCASSWRSSTAW